MLTTISIIAALFVVNALHLQDQRNGGDVSLRHTSELNKYL